MPRLIDLSDPLLSLDVFVDELRKSSVIFEIYLDSHPGKFVSRIVQAPADALSHPLYQRNSIVLAPLEPMSGNLLIPKAETVRLKSFVDALKIEFDTKFLYTCRTCKVPVIVLSAPKAVEKEFVSRLYRVPFPKEVEAHFEIQQSFTGRFRSGPKETETACIIDLSESGAAIEVDRRASILGLEAAGTSLQISFCRQNRETLELTGLVRNVFDYRTARGLVQRRCGIQFTIESGLRKEIGFYVAELQRVELRRLSRIRFSSVFELTS